MNSQLLGDKWRRAAERHFTSAGTQTSSASESGSDAAAGRRTAATRLLWACEEAVNNLQPSLVTCLIFKSQLFSLLLHSTCCIRLFVRHLFPSCVVTLRVLPAATPFLRSKSNWAGDAVNKSATSPSVEAVRNIRGGPGFSDVSDCISSSGQPSIWLGVCCPDPEPGAPGVSQGPAEARLRAGVVVAAATAAVAVG